MVNEAVSIYLLEAWSWAGPESANAIDSPGAFTGDVTVRVSRCSCLDVSHPRPRFGLLTLLATIALAVPGVVIDAALAGADHRILVQQIKAMAQPTVNATVGFPTAAAGCPQFSLNDGSDLR